MRYLAPTYGGTLVRSNYPMCMHVSPRASLSRLHHKCVCGGGGTLTRCWVADPSPSNRHPRRLRSTPAAAPACSRASSRAAAASRALLLLTSRRRCCSRRRPISKTTPSCQPQGECSIALCDWWALLDLNVGARDEAQGCCSRRRPILKMTPSCRPQGALFSRFARSVPVYALGQPPSPATLSYSTLFHLAPSITLTYHLHRYNCTNNRQGLPHRVCARRHCAPAVCHGQRRRNPRRRCHPLLAQPPGANAGPCIHILHAAAL